MDTPGRETAELGADAGADPTLPSSHTVLLGRFQLVRRLGRGGMGEVFEARDLSLSIPVALKIIGPEWIGNPGALERLRREVVLARRVTHPNVCRIFEFFDLAPGGGGFLTMELLAGETLAERLRRNGAMGPDEALALLRDVANGLEAIHASGIVHRDLKPSNVMLVPLADGGERGVVTDFGIALAGEDQRLTSTGAVVGTPLAMPPEQRAGKPVTPRSDVFALALLAREMVTADAARPGPARPVPGPWRAPLERSLSIDPQLRHSTPGALVDALSGRRRRWRRWAIALSALLALVAGGLVLRRPSQEPVPPSVAVLPLANLSTDPGDAYLGDGLTEDLLTELAHVPALKVISRTSSMAYRNTAKPLRQIADELGVATVLEGSVRRSGGRVRISLQLIDARNDAQLWADTYDRDARDVLDLQTDVARRVAGALRVRLSGQPASQLGRGGTRVPEAYDAYLRGLVLSDRWLEEPSVLAAASSAFQDAVRLDPSYALAHAQLALMAVHRATDVEDENGPAALALAKAELDRAEQLDPEVALVHFVRALLLSSPQGGNDVEGALAALRKARSLDPKLAQWEAAFLYSHAGLARQAIREARAAMEVDPWSHIARDTLLVVLTSAARHSEALATWDRMQVPRPSADLIDMSLVNSPGRRQELTRVLPSDSFAWFALLEALEGRRAEAGQSLARFGAIPAPVRRTYHHDTYAAAAAAAQLGQPDLAVHWLRRTAELGYPNYSGFLDEPLLVPLHGHPAYEAFMSELRTRWLRWDAENP